MEERITFEENMTKLSRIVSELEKGDIPLEKAVELYGEGVKAAALCRKQLDEAQIKITEDDGTALSEKQYE
ncbi:MAG: exodeoxyribonuclease VII small subunit [Ruminococcus sp.]|nr:exodeoxyribonuclease VII small subunit [Ruminococcus sp.]